MRERKEVTGRGRKRWERKEMMGERKEVMEEGKEVVENRKE
jgi:hypothetical protein